MKYLIKTVNDGGIILEEKNNSKSKYTRKDKIYNLIRKLTECICKENVLNDVSIGFDTKELSNEANITRTNVSRELNALVKEGKCIKILGKPVLYMSKIDIEKLFNTVLHKNIFIDLEDLRSSIIKEPLKLKEPDEIQGQKNNSKVINRFDNLGEIDNKENINDESKNIFNNIIGANESLKNQVKQAIAAIMYPPNGLHTLLIGPTGVGKTTFAEIMYRYATEKKRLDKNAPYIIFNCADYASNPQLLLSHLFGHTKGAFTGADRDKKGLIDVADNGILFLDEVHRLPAEGQEMLFSLMDRGKFRRLGESVNIHKANVLIIAATTEDINQAILNTFLRRIPCTINLPGLADRSLQERMKLICMFFKEESEKIKLPVTVSIEVLKLFLLYECPGNIGQLKNDIQLTCANAFVECITENMNQVNIKLSQLSSRFKEGIFKIDNKREELMKGFDLDSFTELTFNSGNVDFDNNLEKLLLHDNYETEEDFYESLLNSSRRYFREGIDIEDIKKNINIQVEEYFNNNPYKKLYKESKDQESALLKVVSKKIVETVNEVLSNVAREYELIIDQKVVYSLSLHIENLIERLKRGIQIYQYDILMNSNDLVEEYEVAEKIKNELEEKLNFKIPKEEAAFIAMFLYALKTRNKEDYIGILVLAHGYGTASNIAEVANSLLDVKHANSIDMPLEEKVSTTLDKAVKMVKNINRGKGVLLLVDMGSLTTFSDIITERTGIPTRTIRMVSTPMVIEATRKSMLPNIDLDTLVEEVNNLSGYVGEGIKVENYEYNRNESKINIKVNYDEERFSELLEQILTFLNPRKAYVLLNRVYLKILADLKLEKDDGLAIKFLFHTICMIERVIRNETFQNKRLTEIKERRGSIFNIIKNNFELINNCFNITIPDSELAYIVEMIDIYLN